MDLQDLLYKDCKWEAPGAGRLLVAEPLLRQPPFDRSAVMLVDGAPEKGYMGLVLNKQTSLTMADLVAGWPGGARVRIYEGGPVDPGRLFMLHTLGAILDGSEEVAPGVYVGGDLSQIAAYLQCEEEPEGKIRFFLGYSGWDSGQLEGEIKRRSWMVQKDTEASSLLKGHGQEYWEREVRRLGEGCRNWLIVPQSPELN